jgi:hypothetical protein
MDLQDRSDAELASHRREERMRYEVLAMISRACRRDPEDAVDLTPAVERIGVWRDELFRVIAFLVQAGLARYSGPGAKVCITPAGIDHLYGQAKLTRAVADPG